MARCRRDGVVAKHVVCSSGSSLGSGGGLDCGMWAEGVWICSSTDWGYWCGKKAFDATRWRLLQYVPIQVHPPPHLGKTPTHRHCSRNSALGLARCIPMYRLWLAPNLGEKCRKIEGQKTPPSPRFPSLDRGSLARLTGFCGRLGHSRLRLCHTTSTS